MIMNNTPLSLTELYESRHEPEFMRPIAEAYWRILLLGSIVGALSVIAFGFWQFRTVLHILSDSAAASNAQTNNVLDRTQLQDALARFDARSQAHSARSGSAPVAVDPSIK
jgi:hypothetical protein